MALGELKKKCKEIKPLVDNPAGLIHNYMARKPFNIVSAIIESLTSSDGVVCDPLFGSGTTIIEAAKLGRTVIGTDINPIAYKLCHTSLLSWDIERITAIIDQFVSQCKEAIAVHYTLNDGHQTRIIERCHFNIVNGELIPISYWYKEDKNGKLSGRKKTTADSLFLVQYASYKNRKVFIQNKSLLENSRIAIAKGSTLHTYFCDRNWVVMDTILDILHQYNGLYGYDVLELLVSSSVNLIKLSDKKASSQMPYWLPKENVTSRNAAFVLEKKADALKKGLQYLHDHKHSVLEEENVSGNGMFNTITLQNIPAQDISYTVLPDSTVDLILTDPPYTDQVPYMEYSQLTIKLLGWDENLRDLMERELVVSDAVERNKTEDDFYDVWNKIVVRYSKALKENGYFVMFYHSFNLRSWSKIIETMSNAGLTYKMQIPIPAPRKSFKTVMTPKGTLDGNYIVIFQKEATVAMPQTAWQVPLAQNAAVECAERIIRNNHHVTSQDLYDTGMLKDSIERGYLRSLSTKYSTFVDVIKNKFEFNNGYWRV